MKAGGGIEYFVAKVEEMGFGECFDVVFCNSAFQWFDNPKKAVENFYRALRKGGRAGIQAPAKKMFCPNFVAATEKALEDERTAEAFKTFKNPWIFFETAEEYAKIFENAGFTPAISRIQEVSTSHSPEETFMIFESGAAAGYLNQAYYGEEIGADYLKAFREIVKNEFSRQAGRDGKLKLVFNRIFLVAEKE